MNVITVCIIIARLIIRNLFELKDWRRHRPQFVQINAVQIGIVYSRDADFGHEDALIMQSTRISVDYSQVFLTYQQPELAAQCPRLRCSAD